jgi:hypothetical protein
MQTSAGSLSGRLRGDLVKYERHPGAGEQRSREARHSGGGATHRWNLLADCRIQRLDARKAEEHHERITAAQRQVIRRLC